MSAVGQGMRACKKPAMVRLRREYENEIATDLRAWREFRDR